MYGDTVFASRPKVEGHTFANLTPRRLGMTALRPHRYLWGWSWECECGVKQQTNEHKHVAVKQWREHRIHLK